MGYYTGMKLLCLNVEGIVHIARAMPFIQAERADVVCLQEAGTPYVGLLEALGYHVTFVPRCIRVHEGEEFVDGLIWASLVPGVTTMHQYYTPYVGVRHEKFDSGLERYNNPGLIVLGSVVADGKTFTIGTTHFTWTPNGDIPGSAQLADMPHFLKVASQFQPHIMCGDFNIPRATNRLYTDLLTLYRDEIPTDIAVSLDPEFHKLKDIADQAHKLHEYMVDYIFSQPSYTVTNVRQVFGVSDHAATVCEVL